VSGPFVSGTGGSGAGQYFTDGASNPIMVRGDTVWALSTNAGQNGGATTYQTDIDNYCSTRASQGFNAFFMHAPVTVNGGGKDNNGETFDNVLPFTSPGVLNNTYWTRVDYAVTSAQSNNLTVFLNVCDVYAFTTMGACMYGWTAAQYTSHGTAIGNRYKTYPNIVWVLGDDLFDSTADDAVCSEVKNAITATGDTHLWSVQNYAESTSRYNIYNGTVRAWGASNAQFNFGYSFNTAYNVIEYAYGEASPLPVLTGETIHDPDGSRTLMRNQAWWSLSSGARGYIYTRNAIATWDYAALSNMATNTFDNSDLGSIWNAFTGLPGWHQLIPDTTSALVTAGRGTHSASLVSGGGGGSYSSGNTYVTASVTGDGKLAVVYLPSNATITVSDTLLAKPYVAKWMDPVSGALTAATKAATYNNAGTNSAGGADWVLVFESTTPEASPPLEVSGFGTFTSVASGAIIHSVTVNIGEYQSDPAMGACTFQLWDAGTAQIGGTATGTASTSSANVSAATFTGVTYSQLATLRVRVFGNQGGASAGATESVDWVSLTVNYSAPGGASGYAGVWTAVVVCG